MTSPANLTSVPRPITRIIIFSHISERDGATLLRCIASTLQERHTSIQYLIISTYEQRLDGVNDTGELLTRRVQDLAFSFPCRSMFSTCGPAFLDRYAGTVH